MRDLPEPAVFSARDAVAHGWTSSALKHAVRSGRIVRIRRGIYTTTGVDALVRARAAARAHPDLPLSHRSGLLLHRLPLIGAPVSVPQMTTRPASNANLPGVHPYRASLREHDVSEVDGTLVTSVSRTLIDVARHHRIDLAVVAMDAALHRGLTSFDELDDVLGFCRSWFGAARARRAVDLADGRAESPLESLSRLVIPQLGLPPPEPQRGLGDQDGQFVGRGDFYWDEFGVVGEADGRGKYDERPILTAEKDRQEALADLGLEMVRWGWVHVTRQHDVLHRKLLNGFERGRRRDRAGFPRLWTLLAPRNVHN